MKKCIILIGAFTCLIALSTFAVGATLPVFFVDPNNGSDSNAGTVSNPWKTLGNSVSKLRAGDTLYLRGGTYFERQIIISAQGAQASPITIINYPGEKPIIDGGYTNFRSMGNRDWETHDASKNIYRSVTTFSSAGQAYGYFENNGSLYRLIPYNNYTYFSTTNGYSDDSYVGPGVFWNSSDTRFYVRLQPPNPVHSRGNFPMPPIDPRQVKLYISGSSHVILFDSSSAYIHWEGIDVRLGNNCFKFNSGAHHINVKNCEVLGGTSHILTDNVSHLLFDGITIPDSIPPYVSWLDVKGGGKPAGQLAGAGMNFRGSPNNVEVKNCSFINAFDGIDMVSSPYDIYIHHNTFYGVRDDCLQIGTAGYNIEVGYNAMIDVSKGPSRNGSGEPGIVGTKYFHHNIIDTSKKQYGGRVDSTGTRTGTYGGVDNDGMVWAKPFGGHEPSSIINDPWKIYQNTILGGKHLRGTGLGHDGGGNALPSNPQEVYNNILIQVADHWTSRKFSFDGTQIHDGNVYHRIPAGLITYLFSAVDGTNFKTLADLKNSNNFVRSKSFYAPGFESSGIEADPRLDADYVPDPEGPATNEGVSLPERWPGSDDVGYIGALSASSVIVPNQAPTGVMNTPSSNLTITVGESVGFSGTGSDPDGHLPLSYLWQFSSGSGIADYAVKDPGLVNFNTPGTFTVAFTVTDALGLSDPAPATCTITARANSGQPGIIPKGGWRLHYVDSEELVEMNGAAMNAFDGDPSTIWHTEYHTDKPRHPHEIQINLGGVYALNGFRYLPRQDGRSWGRIARYEFYVSTDGARWGNPVVAGTFVNNAREKELLFPEAIGQYIRLRALSEVKESRPFTSAAEITVLGARR